MFISCALSAVREPKVIILPYLLKNQGRMGHSNIWQEKSEISFYRQNVGKNGKIKNNAILGNSKNRVAARFFC
jgi:hypothetical protein